LADDGAQPGVEQLKLVVGVLPMRRDEGVVAEAGNEQHPPRQPGDLYQRRGDAGPRDPLPGPAAGQPAKADAGRPEQGGAQHEHTEPDRDRGVVLSVSGQDGGRGGLQDLRVVEDRSEGGETGAGQDGGAGHGRGGKPAGRNRVHQKGPFASRYHVVVAARASSSGVARAPNAVRNAVSSTTQRWLNW